jgi:hypothetical protein
VTGGRVVMGIDPGYRDTGITVVASAPGAVLPSLLAGVTVRRETPATPGTSLTEGAYLDLVEHALDELAERFAIAAVGIEDVLAPSPHLGTINVTGIIATGVTAGSCRAWARARFGSARVAMVRPRRNGSGHPAAYPVELLDRGGKVAPSGKRRHERSAYDVARAALSPLAGLAR